MSTTVENADPKAGSKDKVNKFAEARLAKKKQRRKAHRKTINRPNTNG